MLEDLLRGDDPDSARKKDLREWIQSPSLDLAMDFNITDKPFLDEFKDSYYNRCISRVAKTRTSNRQPTPPTPAPPVQPTNPPTR